VSTTSPSGGSNPAKTSGLMTWGDSSVWQLQTTHCKHDESGHSGTRLGDSSASAILFGTCPIGLRPLPRSLSDNLCRVSFNDDAKLQNWLGDFFTANPADFFKRGIKNRPERWEAAINNGGEYIIDWLFDY
jgi:hypothetical protein